MPHLPVCSTEIGGQVVHEAAPTLEEITAGVGRLGGVLYRMGECGLDHFAGSGPCSPVPFDARVPAHGDFRPPPSGVVGASQFP